jgi:hypothetical protein
VVVARRGRRGFAVVTVVGAGSPGAVVVVVVVVVDVASGDGRKVSGTLSTMGLAGAGAPGTRSATANTIATLDAVATANSRRRRSGRICRQRSRRCVR